MHRVIGERDLSETPYGPGEARGLLETMVRARRFDERALALQRRGWMSGYPPFRGQEASQVGAAAALGSEDWVLPTYRQNALLLARGVPLRDLLLFRRGFPEFNSDHDQPNFPQTIPIATQLPIATGIGMAAQHQGSNEAVLACFGDGATSEGDFHEGLNFAGVFGAPVVFFCENNGWAISVRRDQQTASATIAGKAQAYGFEGLQVDGNDPLAVREAVERSFERARSGEPVLVESLTYRQGAHTTADEPDRYRGEPNDLPDWRTADPVDRFEDYLLDCEAIEPDFVASAEAAADEAIASAIEVAERESNEPPEAIFDHVFQALPPRLQEQRDQLLARQQRSG